MRSLTNRTSWSTLFAQIDDDEKLIDELFLRIMARHPTEKERRVGVESLGAAKQDVQLAVAARDAYRRERLAAFDAWLNDVTRTTEWTVAGARELNAEHATLERQSDQSVLASGDLQKDVYSLVLDRPANLAKVTGLRVELMPDSSLPGGGPGRAPNGNLVLNRLTLEMRPSASGEWQPVKLQNAKASFSQSNWSVAGAIDDRSETGWGIMPRFKQVSTATFEAANELALAGRRAVSRHIDAASSGWKARARPLSSIVDGIEPAVLIVGSAGGDCRRRSNLTIEMDRFPAQANS